MTNKRSAMRVVLVVCVPVVVFVGVCVFGL